MQGEEPAERFAPDDRAAENEVHEARSDPWDAARHRHADAESPVGVLVPAEYLAGEGHSECAYKQEHAADPRQFAWVLVGAEQEDLNHVDGHETDHQVRSPDMHRPQEPAHLGLERDVVQRRERLIGRRYVHERQADSRDDLADEQHQRHGAEDIPPLGAAGHRVGDTRAYYLGKVQPRFEPIEQGVFHTDCWSVGRRPAFTCNWPFLIRVS